MKTLANVLMILGLIGLIYFGYEAISATNNVSLLGANVTITSGNWTPVIASGVVLLVGFLLRRK